MMDDLISRQAYERGYKDGEKAEHDRKLEMLLKEKKGKWLTEYDTHTKMLACSACGGRVIYSAYTSAVGTMGYAYCPYCGARMEERAWLNIM